MTLNHANFKRDFSLAKMPTKQSSCNPSSRNPSPGNFAPDSIVLDQTPGTALEILEAHPTPQSCVVLTNNPCPDYLADLLAREPAALLANGESLKQTLKVLELVADGGRIISLPQYPWEPVPLTPCERLVLRLVTRAQCDKRIAKQLGISDGTVRKRISDILDKLGLENRMQLGYYYLGLWSFLDAYRDRMPRAGLGEHLWGAEGTNVHSAMAMLEANLGMFDPITAFGHSRAPQAGSDTGGFMIREVNENEAVEVVGGWIPNPRFVDPESRYIPAKLVPWWQQPQFGPIITVPGRGKA